ncbi:MAG: phosphate signaling complex protein PhoU [Deltaproteobacteria bacterium]|nr:phosphate signaling complex protein PhoU [Deltaproteobacteria bacterium]
MDSRFHQELEQLRVTILKMANLTEKAVENAFRALWERDVQLADAIIARDHEIDQLEMEIDRIILRLLALDQPMARDLRFLVGCMRISSDLERIADQAVSIAHRARYLSTRPALPKDPALRDLTETSLDMLHVTLSCFANLNVDQAMDVCLMDDAVDELNLLTLKNLMDYMIHEAPAIERGVQAIITARCMERVADHCTNIAESVVFIVRGVNIKHHCEPFQ